jgi:hypothetical protein
MDFYYCQGLLLKGIVRMREEQVEGIEGVTRVLIGLIYLRNQRTYSRTYEKVFNRHVVLLCCSQERGG